MGRSLVAGATAAALVLARAQTPTPAMPSALLAELEGGGSLSWGTSNGTLMVTTSAHTVTNYEACAYHPWIDDALNITDTGYANAALAPPLTGADVIVLGAQPTDVFGVDPDPTVECSWEPGSPCGPCPPLVVNATVGGDLTITGVAPIPVYQSCLRRVYMASTAYGGDEGTGDRIVIFGVTRDTEVAFGAPDHVAWVSPDTEACSEFVTSKVSATLSPAGYYPDYSVPCAESCAAGYYTLLVPSIVVTTPEAGVIPGEDAVQYAIAYFGQSGMGAPPSLTVPSQDRLWVSCAGGARRRTG
jgi:hypothetical protein